jgi:hypothetical protein
VQSWELAIEIGISLASAGSAAMGTIWTLARRMQKLVDETEEAKKLAREALDHVKKLDEEVDDDRRQGADQWHDLNRTLGQIEGMMSGGPPINPRGKLPSRGGR